MTGRTVEVYVRSEETLDPPPGGNYADYDAHPCLEKYYLRKTLPPDLEQAIKALAAAAQEKGLTLKIYDVSTTVGRLRARVKGIKTTPVTIASGRKIDGIPTIEELSKAK
ncbi:MAG: hypothetical protein ABR962_04900 [Candidatus Bathyarchaeia archaeon]|jgi:hypothetical protein